MIQLIRDHNELNGIRFSVIEFLLMAVLVVGFAVSVAGAGLPVGALALAAVGANCLVVAAVGVASWRAGEPDVGLRATFSAAARARHLAEHPQAQRATWTLAILTLIPGAVLVLALAGYLRARP